MTFSSDGVWDPEKWHASLYPSECDLSVEGYKRDYAEDRPPLKRRIAGNFIFTATTNVIDLYARCEMFYR